MAQAAAALGLSVDALKAVKDRGCDAFNASGRIDETKLLKWIKDNPDVMAEGAVILSLKDQKISEEIRKLRIQNDAKEGALVSRSRIVEALQRVGSAIDGITEAKLCNEWPEAVAGLDVAGARVYGRRLKDSMMAEIRKLESEWKI
jgi:hypothetical protein